MSILATAQPAASAASLTPGAAADRPRCTFWRLSLPARRTARRQPQVRLPTTRQGSGRHRDDVGDAGDEDGALCVEEHLIAVGVQLAGREAAPVESRLRASE